MLRRRKVESRKQHKKRSRRKEREGDRRSSRKQAAAASSSNGLAAAENKASSGSRHRHKPPQPVDPIDCVVSNDEEILLIYDKPATPSTTPRRRRTNKSQRRRRDLYRRVDIHVTGSSGSSQSVSDGSAPSPTRFSSPTARLTPSGFGIGSISVGTNSLLEYKPQSHPSFGDNPTWRVTGCASSLDAGPGVSSGYICCDFPCLKPLQPPGMTATEEKRLWREALGREQSRGDESATRPITIEADREVDQIEVVPVDRSFQAGDELKYAEMDGVGMIFAPPVSARSSRGKDPAGRRSSSKPWWKERSWSDSSFLDGSLQENVDSAVSNPDTQARSAKNHFPVSSGFSRLTRGYTQPSGSLLQQSKNTVAFRERKRFEQQRYSQKSRPLEHSPERGTASYSDLDESLDHRIARLDRLRNYRNTPTGPQNQRRKESHKWLSYQVYDPSTKQGNHDEEVGVSDTRAAPSLEMPSLDHARGGSSPIEAMMSATRDPVIAVETVEDGGSSVASESDLSRLVLPRDTRGHKLEVADLRRTKDVPVSPIVLRGRPPYFDEKHNDSRMVTGQRSATWDETVPIQCHSPVGFYGDPPVLQRNNGYSIMKPSASFSRDDGNGEGFLGAKEFDDGASGLEELGHSGGKLRDLMATLSPTGKTQGTDGSGVLLFRPTINIYSGENKLQERKSKNPGVGGELSSRLRKKPALYIHTTERECEHETSTNVAGQRTRIWAKHEDDGSMEEELRELAESEKKLRRKLEEVQERSAERRWQAQLSNSDSTGKRVVDPSGSLDPAHSLPAVGTLPSIIDLSCIDDDYYQATTPSTLTHQGSPGNHRHRIADPYKRTYQQRVDTGDRRRFDSAPLDRSLQPNDCRVNECRDFAETDPRRDIFQSPRDSAPKGTRSLFGPVDEARHWASKNYRHNPYLSFRGPIPKMVRSPQSFTPNDRHGNRCLASTEFRIDPFQTPDVWTTRSTRPNRVSTPKVIGRRERYDDFEGELGSEKELERNAAVLIERGLSWRAVEDLYKLSPRESFDSDIPDGENLDVVDDYDTTTDAQCSFEDQISVEASPSGIDLKLRDSAMMENVSRYEVEGREDYHDTEELVNGSQPKSISPFDRDLRRSLLVRHGFKQEPTSTISKSDLKSPPVRPEVTKQDTSCAKDEDEETNDEQVLGIYAEYLRRGRPKGSPAVVHAPGRAVQDEAGSPTKTKQRSRAATKSREMQKPTKAGQDSTEKCLSPSSRSNEKCLSPTSRLERLRKLQWKKNATTNEPTKTFQENERRSPFRKKLTSNARQRASKSLRRHTTVKVPVCVSQQVDPDMYGDYKSPRRSMRTGEGLVEVHVQGSDGIECGKGAAKKNHAVHTISREAMSMNSSTDRSRDLIHALPTTAKSRSAAAAKPGR